MLSDFEQLIPGNQSAEVPLEGAASDAPLCVLKVPADLDPSILSLGLVTPGERVTNQLWIGNLSLPDSGKEQLESIFSQFGTILCIRSFPQSRCAFITFSDAMSALKVGFPS